MDRITAANNGVRLRCVEAVEYVIKSCVQVWEFGTCVQLCVLRRTTTYYFVLSSCLVSCTPRIPNTRSIYTINQSIIPPNCRPHAHEMPDFRAYKVPLDDGPSSSYQGKTVADPPGWVPRAQREAVGRGG